MEHIHPIFQDLVQRKEREELLKQRGQVLWMTGLSGSGKSTIAKGLQRMLHQDGFLTYVLDGDNIRSGLNSDLGFSEEDRTENIRRIAEVAKLFADAGVITLVSFISPTREIRSQARQIIGYDFLETYVNCPLEVAESRDVKGLYKKARKGEIKNFTGIDSPFEAPEQPELEVKTQNMEPEESVEQLYQFLLPKIKIR